MSRPAGTISRDRIGRLDLGAYDAYFSSLKAPLAPILAVAAFLLGDCAGLAASALGGWALVSLARGSWLALSRLAFGWPFLLLFCTGFGIIGLYPGRSLAPSEELRRFTVISFLGFLAMIVTDVVDKGSWKAHDWAFVSAFVASVPVLTAGRVLTRSLCTRAPWWGLPAVVFGADETGKALVDRLKACPWIGYKPAAMLDEGSVSGWYEGVPVIRDLNMGGELARCYGISTAIVALSGERARRLHALTERATRPFRHIILIPDFVGMNSIGMEVRDFEGYLGLSMSQRLMFRRNRALKRSIELCIVALSSIALAPFFLLIALAIKLDSSGPVFYGHKRLGLGEREFTAWKFRTMKTDGDCILKEHLASSPEARKEWEGARKLKEDPRITRVGRFLRSSSLDELPQLWNVIRGELSLIGPRPIVREEIPRYGGSWSVVSSVKPGLTGLWQVSGRSDTSYPERVELDLYYIRSWSLWLDLYILFKTLWIIATGKGAY